MGRTTQAENSTAEKYEQQRQTSAKIETQNRSSGKGENKPQIGFPATIFSLSQM